MNRRQLLKFGILASLIYFTPLEALAYEERSISVYNTHTGDVLKKIVYWEQGTYIPEALNIINYTLRDHRTEEVHKIDPKLVDLMAELSRKIGTRHPFEIVSGYRSLETNNKLLKTSNKVAKNSYHIKGKAVDLYLPNIPLKKLHQAAISMRKGGVGYYPKSGFIHIDTGRVRRW
jgi:uncharacterized protein YcbK (DUF882 family)